jgi:hypothetical protein
MQIIESREIKGHRVNVIPDEHAENPREAFDQLGTILYLKSSRYTLGDEGVTIGEIEETASRNDVYYLPVFAHIHGSIVLNTGGFGDPWDSGQSGIIYVEKAKVEKEYQGHSYTEETILARLKAEVEEHSAYLSGCVYGFQVLAACDKCGHEGVSDSCYGFYSIEDAFTAAEEAL